MATREQLEQALRGAHAAGNEQAARRLAAELSSVTNSYAHEAKPETKKAPSGFKRGIADPFIGTVQGVYNLAPKYAQDIDDKVYNWMVDKGLPTKKGTIDQAIRSSEQDYQKQRTEAGETGIDWGRMGGNMLSPLNLAVASKVPQATGLLGRIGSGMLAGAEQSAMMPVSEGDFSTEKMKQLGIGTTIGAITPIGTGALSRIAKPKSTPEVQSLIKQGVSPTPGQTLGGVAKSAEDRLRSVPLIGDAITAGQRRAVNQFDIATYNRVLGNIGEKLPKGTKPGRDTFTLVSEKISNKYTNLLPKLKGNLDPKFSKDIGDVLNLTKEFPETQAKQLKVFIDESILSKFDEGKISGQTLKNIESKIGLKIKDYITAQDPDQRALGYAFKDLQSSLRDMLSRSNPKHRGELKSLNKAFAENIRVERALTYTGGDEGIFTPAQLNSAVKSLTQGKRKTAFAKGNSLMQDQSSAGREVLTSQYPDSGTAGRALLGAGVAGGMYNVDPAILAGTTAASSMYAPYLQGGVSRLLSTRPEWMSPIANTLKQSSPYLTSGLLNPAYEAQK